MQLPSKEIWIPIVTGVSSFLIGVGTGYGISEIRRHRRAARDNRVEAESSSSREDIVGEAEGTTSPEAEQPELPFTAPSDEVPEDRGNSDGRDEPAIIRIVPRPEDYSYEFEPDVEARIRQSALEEDDNPGTFLVNAFRGVEDDEWDYEREIELYRQNPKRPYVIHADEYEANENDWPHETLTYYAGDLVLVDEQGVPIYDQEAIVGPLPFGHGSMDPNIVFIRNCKIEVEYEVLRDPGHYQYEVLGVEIEHSKKRKKAKNSVPKFKLD